MASICLCANFALGVVKDRYTQYEKTGDQFVGRSVTALTILKKMLAMSPTYFDIFHVKIILRRKENSPS